MIMVPSDLLWLLRVLAVCGLIYSLGPIFFDWLEKRMGE